VAGKSRFKRSPEFFFQFQNISFIILQNLWPENYFWNFSRGNFPEITIIFRKFPEKNAGNFPTHNPISLKF